MGKNKIYYALVKRTWLLSLVFLFLFFIGTAQLSAKDDCTKTYPKPEIEFNHQDAEGRVFIPVVNRSAYPNEMFRKAPELPPCGINTNSSRTWVEIYNADTNAYIYGFCALGSNSDLKGIWFHSTAKSGRVYIIINDRACKKTYKSNILAWGECAKTYPNPKIKFDHQDMEGRVFIPVVNWSAYPNEMFRKAPELPPCGINTNASRTWVEIYNADTNTYIYGFCALGSNSDLKGIWFHSTAKSGRVYIIMKDRACKKTYKSNILVWGECAKTYPKPVIRFDHRDMEGRVFIPVVNWSDYPNEMFRSAPELPPCGTNTNASRTWVDIYNADTNVRIYGFCGFGSNSDLKGIWFGSNANSGRVYIIINDRACQKTYKSNTIRWP